MQSYQSPSSRDYKCQIVLALYYAMAMESNMVCWPALLCSDTPPTKKMLSLSQYSPHHTGSEYRVSEGGLARVGGG